MENIISITEYINIEKSNEEIKKGKDTHLNKINSSQKNMKHTLINNNREVD